MNFDAVFSLANSHNVALVLSLAGNVVLGWVVRKLYLTNEKLNEEMQGFLKKLLPFTIKLHEKD